MTFSIANRQRETQTPHLHSIHIVDLLTSHRPFININNLFPPLQSNPENDQIV